MFSTVIDGERSRTMDVKTEISMDHGKNRVFPSLNIPEEGEEEDGSDGKRYHTVCAWPC